MSALQLINPESAEPIADDDARLAPDNAAATAFLQQWKAGGPWVLTAIDPARKAGIVTQSFDAGQQKGIDEWLERWNGKRNIYFSVNPTIEDVVTNKTSREDIKSLSWLHVDCDPRPGEELATERPRILGHLTDQRPAEIPEPTCIIDSGGGYQAFWRLEEPLPLDGDLAKAEDAKLYNLHLEQALGGDNCHDVSRIMRLPGTINIPDERKRKKGRVEALAYVESFTNALYTLASFSKAPAVQSSGGSEVTVEISGDVVRTAEMSDLSEYNVPDNIQRIIGQGKDPLNPRPVGKDDSKSSWLFQVVCGLVRCKVHDPIIYGIITDKDWAISESVLEKSNVVRYAMRQIERAKESVNADDAPQPSNDVPWLNHGKPLKSAREFRARKRPTLMTYNGDWLAWDGAAYAEHDEGAITSELYGFLEHTMTAPRKDEEGPAPFDPNRKKVGDVLHALKHSPEVWVDVNQVTLPCWIEGSSGPPPNEILACRNGLLHLDTMELLPPTPHFFTRNALTFNYNADAPEPKLWLNFLGESVGGEDEIALLQEMIGYLLLPDTSLQKIFALIGPKRSGKGTIARVIRALVGDRNTVGPSLGSLHKDFGMACLVGKQLAIISDMRMGGGIDAHAVVENILRISGEDWVAFDRKWKDHWEGLLPVRFLIMSNELPKLPDDSGAFANRLVPLMMQNSFLGKEDTGLADKLLAEIPSILLWALEGWKRLQAQDEKNRHFTLPDKSHDAIRTIELLGSPVAGFLEEECVIDVNESEPKDDVYRAYHGWANRNGQHVLGSARFGSALITASNRAITAARRRNKVGDRTPVYQGLRLKNRVEAF